MNNNHWHTLGRDETLRQLDTTAQGLSAEAANKRLLEIGPNTLPEGKKRSLTAMFLGQFSNFMIIVLLAAAFISGFIGEPQDTIAILVIVLLNAIIGTVQEFKAGRAVEALKKMSAPDARVLRDGKAVKLSSVELTSGDVVWLEAGNIVPADLRLLEVEELQTDESALTGESLAVNKQVKAIAQSDLPLGDRRNLAFKSSAVTRGRGRGVVVGTGVHTEIGRIAGLLHGELGVQTPLQVRMAHFGRNLALAVLGVCAIVFTAGLLQGQPVMLMFLTAVSLAVAAIPEALPAVITISLAFGARKLARHNTLVRNLPAVETLGSVTYICTDKTGTLTRNRMTAELFVVDGEQRKALSGTEEQTPWGELGRAMALCNDVGEANGKASGEPTELALYEAAKTFGFSKDVLERDMVRKAAIPFDSVRKEMTTLHQREEEVVAYVKGAPERILPQSDSGLGHYYDTGFNRDEVLEEAERLANEGYRVLAFAKRHFKVMPDTIQADQIEQQLSFIGLVALIDPPRTEAPQAVADCKSAGITPVMITGDHPGTAWAIAKRLGIVSTDEKVLTGDELASLSDEGFAGIVKSVRVYARVSPEQKLRIIKALQAHDEFVAMTGDGVNDAPALKRASIGVAMGQKGTDVAREASDMVLLDDNFATIVHAVGSGRRIFDNIRKFIKDTMSSNSGEIWTLFLAPFLGLPVPLLPIHILWINLVTDGLPGLAFTVEPAESGLMRRAPRSPGENIFAHGMWQHIVWVGLFVGGISIASQAWAITRGVEYWQTVVFTVLTVSQLFHSLAVRTESVSLFKVGLTSNLPMLGAVLFTMLLQIAVIYLPSFNAIFHTQPLPLYDLVICLLLSTLVLFAVEMEKWLIRRGIIYQTNHT